MQHIWLRVQWYDLQIKPHTGKVHTCCRCTFTCHTYRHSRHVWKLHKSQVSAVLKYVPIMNRKIKEIQVDTLADPIIQTLKIYIIHGWPASVEQCQTEIALYFNHWIELLVQQNLILKGKCMIIPLGLMTQIFEEIYTLAIKT